MVEIYAVNVERMTEEEFNKIDLNSVSEERRRRIARYKFLTDKKSCFFAEKMIYFYMQKKYKIIKPEIIINDVGKPEFSEYRNKHFNISHSGDWIICAFSKYSIGADIEKIGKGDIRLAEKYYNVNEYKKLLKIESLAEQSNMFYLLWTLKESYVKNIGLGIKMISPKLMFETGKYSIGYDNGKRIDKIFYSHIIDNNYYLSICYETSENIVESKLVTVLDIDELLSL